MVDELGLTIMWEESDNNPDHFIQHVDYTYLHTVNNTPFYSTIDHFAASPQVYKVVNEAGVIHNGGNPSNHSAIYAKLNVGDLNLQVETLSSEKRSSWSKANEDAKLHFRECLANNLDQVHPEVNLLQCRDLHCKGHRESLESYTLEVLESIETAARATLPSTGGLKLRRKSQ